jgi:hypothetical protein
VDTTPALSIALICLLVFVCVCVCLCVCVSVCVCVYLHGVQDPPFSINKKLHGCMGCANASTRKKHDFPFVVPHCIVPQLRLFREPDVGETDTV